MSKDFIKNFITIIMIFSICFSFTVSSFSGNDREIFFYDGTTITKLTDNDYENKSPQINDSGEVVWHAYDGNDREIFLEYIKNKTYSVSKRKFQRIIFRIKNLFAYGMLDISEEISFLKQAGITGKVLENFNEIILKDIKICS